MSTHTLLQRLEKTGTAIETVFLVSLLTTMMLVAVGQIVLREVFGTGMTWADELIRLIVLWLAMVGSVAACRENRHIRIDALSHILPDALVGWVRVLVDLFAAVVCVLVAFHAWRYLQIEIEYEDTVLIDTPAWIAHGVIPVAFALIAYRFVISSAQQALENINGKKVQEAE